MQIFELQGELRTDLGKKATNLLRVEGKVPCVLVLVFARLKLSNRLKYYNSMKK